METTLGAACDAADLQQTTLFRSANQATLSGALQGCRTIRLRSGEQLLVSGQANSSVYVLLQGRLRVHLEGSESDPFMVLQGGDCVGEMSVIDRQLTSATVIADENCRLLELDQSLLWSLIEDSPVIARNLLEVLTQRLRHGNSVICRSQQLQRHFAHHAVTDPLTGLYNRRWLDEMLPQQMICCRDDDQPFSLLIADIDFFKDFNDRYGHLAGDQAISAIAATLQHNLRKSDMAVRFGGEEFLVLLPGSDLQGALHIAERIRQAVKRTPLSHGDGRPLPAVTVSIGVAQMSSDDGAAELIEKADNVLYLAKQQGRDSVVA